MKGRKFLKNRIFVMLLGMALVCSLMPLMAHARTAIDVDEDVSLTIKYTKNDVILSGAVFGIYRVADVSPYAEFDWAGDFEGYNAFLENLDQSAWAKLAEELAVYVNENPQIRPLDTGVTDVDGVIEFPDSGVDMATGLYLVIGQDCEVEEGIYSCSPFLISLPNIDADDTWDYHPLAEPKAGPPETDEPDEPKLPQTGMLNWPIPVLAGTGVLFFMIGWAKRQKEEK